VLRMRRTSWRLEPPGSTAPACLTQCPAPVTKQSGYGKEHGIEALDYLHGAVRLVVKKSVAASRRRQESSAGPSLQGIEVMIEIPQWYNASRLSTAVIWRPGAPKVAIYQG